MKYTSILKEDHNALRNLMARLKSKRLSEAKKDQAFALFVDLLQAHTVAEEKSLYEVRSDNPWLRPNILEGLQEHRIAEELITKIKYTRNQELRDAKVKVLCDYVEHHLDEEEEELFPHFEKTISALQSKKLQQLYIEIKENTQKL